MIIRDEQKRAFEDSARQTFMDRATQHLYKCFPAQCQALGPAGVRRFIRVGTKRAKRWNIQISRDVCLYLDIMMTLGVDFDRDPRLPWARRILGATTVPERTRMDRLFEAVVQMLGQLSSPPVV